MRRVVGHGEINTVKGGDQARRSVVSLVERSTGYLRGRQTRAPQRRRGDALGHRTDRQAPGVRGHDHGRQWQRVPLLRDVKAVSGALFYFATSHHSWERGTNENTNGLIRQYLPKRTSMAHVTQEHCDAIAKRLNSRPSKRLGCRTLEECYAESW